MIKQAGQMSMNLSKHNNYSEVYTYFFDVEKC